MGTVADKLSRLLLTKEEIRSAIVEKGQAVTETDPFSEYPNKIRNIQTVPAREYVTVHFDTQSGYFAQGDASFLYIIDPDGEFSDPRDADGYISSQYTVAKGSIVVCMCNYGNSGSTVFEVTGVGSQTGGAYAMGWAIFKADEDCTVSMQIFG